MPLIVTTTPSTITTCEPVLAALRASMDACGRAQLLVPSARVALEAQRALAAEGDLCVGVGVAMPASLAAGLWGRYGDGRALVSSYERQVLARVALDGASDEVAGPVDRGTGTARLVARLAAEAMSELPVARDGSLDESALPSGDDALTLGELAAVRLVAAYQRELDDLRRVEPCVAMRELPGMVAREGGPACGVVASGFVDMPVAQRRLLLGLAANGWDVTVVVPVAEGPAGAQALALARELAAAGGTEVAADLSALPSATVAAADRAPELADLLDRLYRADDARPVAATGAVRLMEALGPLAEAELAATEVADLIGSGARRVVVSVPDVRRAWRELAPKLAARGASVAAQLSVRVPDTMAGGAFLGFAECVAELMEVADAWPEPVEDERWGSVPALGDMSWWPPRRLTDFLLSGISGVTPEQAWALDRKWRGDRLLTPRAVLDDLVRVSSTSRPTADAMHALEQGRMGTAAEKLRRALPETMPGASTPEATEADTALAAITEACRSMGRMGVACERARRAPEGALPLSRIAHMARDMAELVTIGTHPVLEAADGASLAEVAIASSADVARMGVGTAEALVVCGLTTNEAPVSPDDGSYELLAAKLGCAPLAGPLERERARFSSCVAVPTQTLVLGRAATDDESKETYPAVVLTELLEAYGYHGGKGERMPLSIARAGEDRVTANLSGAGEKDRLVNAATPGAAGRIDDALRGFVVVPRNGTPAEPGLRPSLSASQIESYLECPYKWFSLRRLGLDEVDAGFSNLEKGSFVHRVLEVTHRALLREAAGVPPFGKSAPAFDDPRPRIAGSRVSEGTLARAIELMDAEFDAHLAHQRQRAHRRSDQALVPHVPSEGHQLDRLRADLRSTLEYECGILTGFEPRYFELRFGGSSGIPVAYAGADFVGSIDRIDVDEAGHAVIIDYKHKSRLFSAYALGQKDVGLVRGELPRHVQALIYAQVVRRHLAEMGLEAAGAVYLGTRGEHELSGAVPASMVDRVWGQPLKAPERVTAGLSVREFNDILDESEELVAKAVEAMRAGDVEARPIDRDACSWCPVVNCERRLG